MAIYRDCDCIILGRIVFYLIRSYHSTCANQRIYPSEMKRTAHTASTNVTTELVSDMVIDMDQGEEHPYETLAKHDPSPELPRYHSIQVRRLGVAWHDVCFNVQVKDPETKKVVDKAILQDVHGEALPGELVVLMGPSGAGKSTLLDCIAGRNTQCSGTVLVNGYPWSKAIAKHACYVMQDDLFDANLTVLEHLTFQAHLRMPRHTSASERAERVTTVVRELGLTKVLNTRIGDVVVKGLSGGQRKRLSFATELLTNPSLLFVDEPTSGLDSCMAESVVRQMRELARRGRTVIATIHQPSSDLFELFDRLYLLVDGCTVYDGKATASIEYFASQGLQCPSFMNPTDYFMKQLVVMDDEPDSRERVNRLVAAWAAHRSSPSLSLSSERADDCERAALHECAVSSNSVSTRKQKSTTNDRLGFCEQFMVLCQRNGLRLLRDNVNFRARLGSTVIVALVSSLVFFGLERNQRGVQDFTGALFFMTTFQMMSSANPEFVSVPLEIPLITREHDGGIYHALTWYLAKNVSELPLQVLFPLLFLLPTYFMIGFDGDAEMFMSFSLFMVLVTSTSTAIGYMVSCASRRVDIAPTLGILVLLPFLLFGGLFLNGDSTPEYFVWLEDLSPVKYCFHGLMRAFWTTVGTIECTSSLCAARTGMDVLATNGIEDGRVARDALVLVGLNVGFRLLGGVFLWWRVEKTSTR